MEIKERYVLCVFKNIQNIKNQRQLVHDYLQEGNCIKCESREGCPAYGHEMFTIGIRIIPFGESLETVRTCVSALLLNPEIQLMLLLDNNKQAIYIYRMNFSKKQFQEEILAKIAQEYDGLLSNVSIRKYEMHDLREVMLSLKKCKTPYIN